jgi:hypothetical protein
MNELGQTALTFFREHPNVAPENEATDLAAHCEALGDEMASEVEQLTTQLWFRAQQEIHERRGRHLTDGDARAALLRTARVEAETLVVAERLYDLLEQPRMSPRTGPERDEWDEDLADLTVPWHPDWADLLVGSPLWLTTRTEEELLADGFVLADPWTWWRVFPTPPAPGVFLSPVQINEALADGRLVWDGDTVVPTRMQCRLADEAAGVPARVEH